MAHQLREATAVAAALAGSPHELEPTTRGTAIGTPVSNHNACCPPAAQTGREATSRSARASEGTVRCVKPGRDAMWEKTSA